MVRDVPKHGAERADLKRVMVGDRDVMLARLLRGDTNVASRLSRDLVPEMGQGGSKLTAGDIPRQLQSAMTSSLTE